MDQNEIELQLFHSILRHSIDAIIVVDGEGVVRYLSESASRFFRRDLDQIVGQSFWKLVPEKQIDSAKKIWQRLTESTSDDRRFSHPFTFEFATEEGKSNWMSMSFVKACIGEESWAMAIGRDVTTQQRRESELKIAANSDSLSGLSNRGEFQRKLEANISQSLGLAILDIDDFKLINDQFGHLAGDAVIRTFSDLLQKWFPKAISLSRLGGDEFGILVQVPPSCASDLENGNTCVQKQLRRLKEECENTNWASGELQTPSSEMTVTFSGGFAITGPSIRTPRELLQAADERLYRAKSAGKNRIVYL